MNREEKNALSRQRILAAALEEFSLRGYETASLSNVCAEKGISKGLIYHHFKDKDELYFLCVEDCFTQVSAYLQEAAGKRPLKFFLCLLCLTVFSVAILTGCGKDKQETVEQSPLPSQVPVEMQAPVETPEPVETPAETAVPEPMVITAGSREELKNAMADAIEGLCPWLTAEIAGNWLAQPDMDIRNVYYEIMAARPDLKYVSDLEIQADGSQLVCTFHYMPYKTGDFPEGFADIVDLKFTNHMEAELDEIENGKAQWRNVLADQVIAQVIDEGMSQQEKAEALYAYVTGSVSYDQRYYSDKSSMPYESQTALGALRDGMAICGGYCHAVKLLFEKAGIPCYNVTGTYFSENHMWNIALLDGQWLWFDATSDRGSTGEFGFLRFALTELDCSKYQWNQDEVLKLIG